MAVTRCNYKTQLGNAQTRVVQYVMFYFRQGPTIIIDIVISVPQVSANGKAKNEKMHYESFF